MTVTEFFNQYNGKGIDFDGFYGLQCMDLAEQYNKDVVGAPRMGNPTAADCFDHFNTDCYERFLNTPEAIPQLGDVIIWDGKLNGGPGHIAVFQQGDANTFTSFDQNWPTGSPCHFQQHDYSHVLGWLRPKHAATANVSVPADTFNELVGKASRYDAMDAAGYHSIDDITTKLSDLNKRVGDLSNDNTNLTKALAGAKQSNANLANEIQTIEQSDATAIDAGVKAETELSAAHGDLNAIADAVGVKPYGLKDVLSKIDELKTIEAYADPPAPKGPTAIEKFFSWLNQRLGLG